jgi:hypothetical protein
MSTPAVTANGLQLKEQPRERYRHRVTKKSYVLILEIGGACELEGIDRHCTHTTREALDDSEIWERLT